MRSIVYMTLAVLLTVTACPVIILCFWLPHRPRRHMGYLWVTPMIWLIKNVLGITYELRGRENIVEPAVILCKHQSALETILLQEIFPDVLFVWKKELKLIPFFGWAIATMPMISIDRKAGKNALKELVRQGKMRLAQGYSIAIFPEGTRVDPGAKNRYKIGGAFLAAKAGASVLPIAVNSGEVWRRNAFFKRPGRVVISIGPRIEGAGSTPEVVNGHAEFWIESEMRNISPHLYPNALA